MKNRIIFHMVFAHRKQKRSGNAEQALIEYAKARLLWEKETQRYFEEHGESAKTWNNAPEEPGTKQNKFEATNGVKVWWDNLEHEQIIIGDDTDD